MNEFIFGCNLFIILLIAVLFFVIPNITRKSLLFGVRVPDEAAIHQDALALKKRYRRNIAIGSLLIIAFCLTQYLYFPAYSLLLSLYYPLFLLIVQLIAYIPVWKQAKALKEEHGWYPPNTMSIETRAAYKRSRFADVPWIWIYVSLALLIITTIICIPQYANLPDKIPTHYNFAMEPDAWSDKSIGSAFFSLFFGLGMLIFMLPALLSIYIGKLQVNVVNPAKSFAQHRVYRRMMGHSMGFIIFTCILIFVVLQLETMSIFPQRFAMFLMLGTIALMLIGTGFIIIITLKAGQGGNKLDPPITEADIAASGYEPKDMKPVHPGRGDDAFWKLGMFYYNPDDPAVFIEDRFGSNMGFNYARISVKIVMALLLLGLIITYAFSTSLFWAIIHFT